MNNSTLSHGMFKFHELCGYLGTSLLNYSHLYVVTKFQSLGSRRFNAIHETSREYTYALVISLSGKSHLNETVIVIIDFHGP